MALPEIAGYERLSPKQLEARGLSAGSRSVLTPGGEVISRRQYENLRIEVQRTSLPEAFGWRNWSQFQAARKSPIYQFDLDLAAKANPDVSAKQLRSIDSEFNKRFVETRPLWKNRKSAAYRDPNGPVADFLVYLGLRDEDDTHDVGETQPDGTKH